MKPALEILLTMESRFIISNLFLGCKGKRFIVSMYGLKSDINSVFTLPTLIVYENVFPTYMKISLTLTGGITSLFNLR